MLEFFNFYAGCFSVCSKQQQALIIASDFLKIGLSIVFVMAVLVSFLLLFWIKRSPKVPKHEQNPIVIQKIYPIHSEQILVFFAICVVAFSMKSYENYHGVVFLCITIFLFILFMLHNVSYLNPIWFFLSYRVYRIESLGTNYIFIMKNVRKWFKCACETKRQIKAYDMGIKNFEGSKKENYFYGG